MSNNLGNCKHCRGITLQRLADGYRHAPSRASLVRSAQKCKLCSLLFRKDRSRESSQILLRLEPFSVDDPQICLRVSHVDDDASMQQQLSLFLFTSPGDPALDHGINLKRHLSTTGSVESFTSASNWIGDCVKHHDCSTRLMLKEQDNGMQLWPSRLVDVNAFDAPCEDLKLVDNNGSLEKYITLSYCWGHSRTFKTTSRSIRLRRARITYDTLPKTFQDAVQITRRLGVRYLWIDALCIMQDDRRDWERESTKMGAIYSMAFLTIAANSSSDCNGGCFNEKSTSQDEAFENGKPFELVCRTPGVRSSSVFIWDPNRGTRRSNLPEIDGSPLSERGWVCQERILSPRILHYTRTQLFYECRQHLLAEDNLRPWTMWSGTSATVCGLARNLYGMSHDAASRELLLDIWYTSLVSQSYSRRKLTLPDDKLTAVSGIARAFHRHLQSEYVAGLWVQQHLAWGLSWRVRGAATKPPAYRAPSFSWAALDGIVEWPPLPSSEDGNAGTAAFTLLDTRLELDGEDPFGRVATCALTVRGRVQRAAVAARKHLSAGAVDHVWELRSEPHDRWLGTAYMDAPATHEGRELVECLLLSRDAATGRAQVLLLRRIDGGGDGDEEEEAYERTGVGEVLGLDKDAAFFEGGPMRTLTLY